VLSANAVVSTPPWGNPGTGTASGYEELPVRMLPAVVSPSACPTRCLGGGLLCILLQATARPPEECSRKRTMESRQVEVPKGTTNKSIGEENCRGVRSFVQTAYTDFVSSRAHAIAASVQRAAD
jgi:hypothetical protein